METPGMTENKTKINDPFLDCLIILSKYYNRPSSPEGLTAGFPLDENNHITLDSFIRSASRNGIFARVLKISLDEIHASYLPVVIFLQDESPCILKEWNADGTASIIRPLTDAKIEKISRDNLKNEYTGAAILISPTHLFDPRAEEPGKPLPRRWFWNVMKKAWAVYSEIIIASFLINIFALASPLFIMNVYNRVVPNQATATLWVLFSGVLIVFIFDFIMRNLRAYFIDAAGKNIDMQLSKDIFSHILDIRLGIRPNSVGSLANTVQSFESFREFITSTTISILVDVPFAIIFLVTIALLGGWLVMVPICAIPVILFFGYLIQKPLDEMIRKNYRYSSERHAVLVETLSSMEAIKGMHVEGFMQKRYENVAEAASILGIKLRSLATFGINFSMFTQQLAVVILVVCGVFLIQAGTLSVGGLVACTILASRALVPIAQLAGILARYEQSKTSIVALDQVMQLPTERPINKNFLYLSKLDGDIEFRKVTFYYPEQPVAAINKLSFEVKAGEKIGVIGATGSGKSTILKLIMKFYDPTTGNILIDHFEEQQLDPAELRHFIGYVPQDVTLFHGSIKENINFGAPQVDDSAIIRAAQLSTVDTFVAHHPEGFNRLVGERGQFLSGGQRQAIVIARALLLNPSVVLFDELGNSMDDGTISLLIARLKPYVATKTLLLVTHKPILLNLVDRLIVMDNGHLVADGPRDEVIKMLTERKIKGAVPETK